MVKKTKHRGRVFAKRLKDAEDKGYSEGYDRGKKEGEAITRYRGVRGLWQTRCGDFSRVYRATDARIFEAAVQSPTDVTWRGRSERGMELAERDAREILGREIAKMATIERIERPEIGAWSVFARISIASVEQAKLPRIQYPFASEPHDSQTLEWHAF